MSRLYIQITHPVIFMIRYPDIQKRVQRELDEVVGLERMPSMKDRLNLPFTEAVVMEIQRCGNILPTGVGHRSSRDVVFNGITIPANVLVHPLLTEVMKVQ